IFKTPTAVGLNPRSLGGLRCFPSRGKESISVSRNLICVDAYARSTDAPGGEPERLRPCRLSQWCMILKAAQPPAAWRIRVFESDAPIEQAVEKRGLAWSGSQCPRKILPPRCACPPFSTRWQVSFSVLSRKCLPNVLPEEFD